MKMPPHGTPQWAARACINSLGVERCAEICGVSATIVYRWADADADVECPMRHARVLDRHAFLRDGITPFRELFEMNAGEPIGDRVARELTRMAEQLKGVAA